MSSLKSEWRGWRGIQREGRSESTEGPIRWSPDTNIRWKTEIRGVGHSSPIVSKDRVFVTTAYSTVIGESLKWWTTSGIILLALLVFCAALWRGQSFRAHSRLGAFAVLLFMFIVGTSICLFVAGHLSFDANNSMANSGRWLFTVHATTLCVMLATFHIPRRGSIPRLIGLAAVVFSVLTVLFRPEPDYFTLFDTQGGDSEASWLKTIVPSYSGRQILGTAGLTFAIGLTLFVGSFLHRANNTDEEADELAGGGKSRLGSQVLALAIGFVFPLVLWVYGKPSDLGSVSSWFQSASGIRNMILVVGFCFLAWLVVFIKLKSRPQPTSPRFAVAALCLACVGFAEKNFVLTEESFVRVVVCMDRKTGEILWEREGLLGPATQADGMNSQASPTPIMDGERVYAYFGTAGMMAVEHDGNLVWTNENLPFGGFHGAGASPTIHDGLIVINNDGGDKPYVTALDSASGKRVWTKKLSVGARGVGGNYRSPIVKVVQSKPVVIHWGWRDLKGLDLRTGDEVFSHPVTLATHEPVAGAVSDDHFLYLARLDGIVALDINKLASGQDPVEWTQRRTRTQTVSPVLTSGMLFVVADNGLVSCIDAKNGKVLWRKRSPQGKYLASTVAIGPAVYVSNDEGVTSVLAAEREYRRLAENNLSDPIFATPAPVDGQFVIRTKRFVWCVGAE